MTLSDEHKAVLLVVLGTAEKGVSQNQGGGDPRAGGLFNLDSSLEPRVDLLRPVQRVEFLAADAIGFAGSGFAAPDPTSPVLSNGSVALATTRACRATPESPSA